MTLKLKGASTASSSTPFSWDDIQSPSPPPDDFSSLPEPPTSWLPARDMKLFGAHPLSSTSDIGVIRCKDCDKPILRSIITDHSVSCAQIRNGKSGSKGKAIIDGEDLSKKSSKKRKASPTPSDPNDPNQPLPKKLKTKSAPKVNKGRTKGPVDYDRQCGVINDKGLPCSRSLTCKSHSMGAKRAVQGRSRDYDDLLLDWQRAHNPNFVEPVKRESKKEKKEKKEREKAERKKAMEEAAVRMGLDPTSAAGKKAGAAAAAAAAGTLTASSGHKKSSKKAAAAAAAVRLAEGFREDYDENLDDLDSEVEVDELVKSLRIAKDRGAICQPLALPCEEGSWFVQRRERARCCTDLLFGALMNGNGAVAPGIGSMGLLGSMGPVSGGIAIGSGGGVAARPSVGASVGGR